MPSRSTPDLLLDAAERLFAEHGFEAASLRSITACAGANLAAVGYHFGSKRDLVRAVLRRRLAPVNAERMRRLEAIEERGAVEVEPIVRAFLEPPLDLIATDAAGPAVARLVLRAFTESGVEVRELLEEQFATVAQRFAKALGDALPTLSREDLHWRFHFLVGSLAFTVGLSEVLSDFSHGRCGLHDIEAAKEQLVAYGVAGLGAPSVAALQENEG